jgi:hypothetical protein
MSSAGPRSVLALELPSRRSLVRVSFEVCDPNGVWLGVGDSPSNDGGGGDDAQFSNDAELELKWTTLWVFGNDYSRGSDNHVQILASQPAFVTGSGCTQRTLVLGDQLVRSASPALDVRSPYALRVDPPADHEGTPDRQWYFGVNRSVGSTAPDRVGSGLAWLEICVR